MVSCLWEVYQNGPDAGAGVPWDAKQMTKMALNLDRGVFRNYVYIYIYLCVYLFIHSSIYVHIYIYILYLYMDWSFCFNIQLEVYPMTHYTYHWICLIVSIVSRRLPSLCLGLSSSMNMNMEKVLRVPDSYRDAPAL